MGQRALPAAAWESIEHRATFLIYMFRARQPTGGMDQQQESFRQFSLTDLPDRISRWNPHWRLCVRCDRTVRVIRHSPASISDYSDIVGDVAQGDRRCSGRSGVQVIRRTLALPGGMDGWWRQGDFVQ
jgi:hypothetical protein